MPNILLSLRSFSVLCRACEDMSGLECAETACIVEDHVKERQIHRTIHLQTRAIED